MRRLIMAVICLDRYMPYVAYCTNDRDVGCSCRAEPLPHRRAPALRASPRELHRRAPAAQAAAGLEASARAEGSRARGRAAARPATRLRAARAIAAPASRLGRALSPDLGCALRGTRRARRRAQ